MRSLINGLDSPKDIFAVAVMLARYQQDTGGNPEDWLLYQDAELMPARRLGELGTPEAYIYFRKLHELYGFDGGGSLLYREMERKYFDRLLTPERREHIRRGAGGGWAVPEVGREGGCGWQRLRCHLQPPKCAQG